MGKKNKLNEITRGKYESPKKSNDAQLSNGVNGNSSKSVSTPVNSNQLKNDTYESVCSPEDVAERTKMAHRHSIAVNNNNHNTITATVNHNLNQANNSRVLKRVVSAPVAAVETKGNKRLIKSIN